MRALIDSQIVFLNFGFWNEEITALGSRGCSSIVGSSPLHVSVIFWRDVTGLVAGRLVLVEALALTVTIRLRFTRVGQELVRLRAQLVVTNLLFRLFDDQPSIVLHHSTLVFFFGAGRLSPTAQVFDTCVEGKIHCRARPKHVVMTATLHRQVHHPIVVPCLPVDARRRNA